MRARQNLHSAVVHIDVVERDPAADQVCRDTFPVTVVLMPVDGTGVMGGFEQGLIVKQLNVRAYQIFYDIENLIIKEKLTIVDVAFAHLHNLKHLAISFIFLLDVFGVSDGEIAEFALAATGKLELVVVFAPQQLDGFIVQHPTDR